LLNTSDNQVILSNETLDTKTHLLKVNFENYKLAVLVPCFNEAQTIAKVVNDFRTYLPSSHIYVFDNNSTDNTAELARASGAVVINSSRQGKGYVVRHMFECIDADYYIMADGDDTYPAVKISEMLSNAIKSDIDMLVGVRLDNFANNAFRRFHRFGNNLVSTLISMLFNVQVTDVLSGYRIFSKNFVKTAPLVSSGFEIETELTLHAVTKRYKIKELPIPYGARPAGSFSKLNTYRDGVLILGTIFRLFKDYKPLFFFLSIASLLFTLSLIAGLMPILDYANDHYVRHIPLAILATGLALAGMIAVAIALVLDTMSKYHLEQFESSRKLLLKNENSLERRL
jgi:glycosyltransferase involved in cell wall biosynthesis